MRDIDNLKIIDCTFRDGGHLNNWNFKKDLVKEAYKASSLCGTDYFEIGYISSKKYLTNKNFGIWRFSMDDDIRDVICEINGSKISVMADYNKIDFKDIPKFNDSIISVIRIATYVNDLKESLNLGERLMNDGYEVFINLMGITAYSREDLINALEMIYHSPIKNIVIADSFGSLLPSDVSKIISIFKLTEKRIGFHAHNNLQMAFANSCTAIEGGADFIDATIYGVGRAAGNLPLELLIAYMENINKDKYNIIPLLKLINDKFLKLSEELHWGYSLKYMLTGTASIHPNYASELLDKSSLDIEAVWNTMNNISNLKTPSSFNKNLLNKNSILNTETKDSFIDLLSRFSKKIFDER